MNSDEKKTISMLEKARDSVVPSRKGFNAALAAIPAYHEAHKGVRKNTSAISWSDYPFTSIARELRNATTVTATGVVIIYDAALATPRVLGNLATRAWKKIAQK